MNETTQNWLKEIDALNHDIKEAERNNNAALISERLTAEFIFSRADKTVVDKKTYLAGVDNKENSYQYLEYINTNTKVDDAGKFATSIVTVAAAGTRGSKSFSGRFKNIRFFRKNENGQWQITAWYNEKIGPGIVTLIPACDCAASYEQEINNPDFEGVVYRESLPSLPASPEMRAFYVKFENGGRTTWHHHTEMQILVVKEGEGFVEEKGNAPFDIFPGDRIYIPKYISHRHGAKPGTSMVHLAINLGDTIWETDTAK